MCNQKAREKQWQLEEPAKLSKSVLQSQGRKMLLAKAEYKVIFFSLLMLLWDLVKALFCRTRN